MDVYYAKNENEENAFLVTEKHFFDKFECLQYDDSDEDYRFISEVMAACGYYEITENEYEPLDGNFDEEKLISDLAEKGINMIRFPDSYYDRICG